METLTSKYVTASRARHVTFHGVFPIALDTLSSLFTLDNSPSALLLL